MTMKRRGEITTITYEGNRFVAQVSDVDRTATYDRVLLPQPLSGQMFVPPIESIVVVQKMHDEGWIIDGVLEIPKESPFDLTKAIEGAREGHTSMGFTFGQPENADSVQKFSIEYRDGGYVLNLNLGGDITINSGGDINLNPDGDVLVNGKEVSVEDHTHDYEDTTVSDTDDGTGTSSTTTKTTSQEN
jgi:hypothetical protein